VVRRRAYVLRLGRRLLGQVGEVFRVRPEAGDGRHPDLLRPGLQGLLDEVTGRGRVDGVHQLEPARVALGPLRYIRLPQLRQDRLAVCRQYVVRQEVGDLGVRVVQRVEGRLDEPQVAERTPPVRVLHEFEAPGPRAGQRFEEWFEQPGAGLGR